MSPQKKHGPGCGTEAVLNAQSNQTGQDVTLDSTIAHDYDAAVLFEVNEHGALIAADAAAGYKVASVEHEIRCAAANGEVFGSDTIAGRLSFPTDGPWVGGIFMRLHREGVIKRAGYRPSRKRSRAGGVIAQWTAGDAA